MIDYDGLFLATLRFEPLFVNDIGDIKTVSGTGFALKHGDNFILVTNRHMVDPSFVNATYTHKINKMFLWCRRTDAWTTDSPSEKFEVGVSQLRIISHPSADAALILGVQLLNIGSPPIINPMMEESLADEEFFSQEIGVADPCVFIGYPNPINPWWDTALGLPIVRLANIASYPHRDFINETIKSTHARLVTGLSFSGSSGSPILNLGSHFRTKQGFISLPGAITPKIIGIMAGHWWNDNKEIPEMLRHTGLSYFVSSIAILELLAKI
jgi:hypothetical protein